MQDFSYSVFSSVAILIHLIINLPLLMGRGSDTERGRRYRDFLFSVLFYYVADSTWGILAGLGWNHLLYVDSIFYFLSLALFAFAWSQFAIAYLGLGKWTTRIIRGFGYWLLGLNLVLLTANCFNKCVFYFNDQGTYLLGNQRSLLLNCLIAFHILIALGVFRKALGKQEVARRRGMVIFVSCITMIVSIVLQIVIPLSPITALGCLTSNCFLHFFVIADEQTEKHMADLEKALNRAHAAEKAKSFFFSSVSHDIRTPLNSIIGFSEILKLGIQDPEEKEKALDAIITSGNTLLELINDVLDLSKLESGKMEINPVPTDMGNVIAKVATAFDVAASRSSVLLRTEIEKMPFLELDPQRIRQILFNLIGNAVKFTTKGTITVRASFHEGIFTLAVVDTGCGISAEDIKKLMSPYVQLREHATIKGTGLGLTICKQLATRMNGTLSIESTLGKGSTFTLRIPNVKALTEEESKAYFTENKEACADVSLDEAIQNLRILIVDDQKLNLRILQTMLSRLGINKVVTAGNGKEALKVMGQSDPVDLVMTDVSMPVMDGIQLVQEIRKDPRFDRIPVYVVSADVEMLDKSESIGFDNLIIKPITIEKLKELLANYTPHQPKATGNGSDQNGFC